MNNENKKMAVVALRGLAVLPKMLIHFDINRKITIAAIETAMTENQKIFLATQKDPDVDEPKLDDLYEIGAIASIKQIVKLPEGVYRVMVSVEERASLCEIVSYEPYLLGEIGEVEEIALGLTALEEKALLNGLKDLIEVK